jgi:hypothetical protein
MAGAPVWAKIDANAVKSALVKNDIFKDNQPVETRLAGSAVIISTYREPSWTDQDCKINAVLAAKAAFATDATLVRAEILLYDAADRSIYDDIKVSLGDVSAFAVGGITHEQLLNGLRMNRMQSKLAFAEAPLSRERSASVAEENKTDQKNNTGAASETPSSASSSAVNDETKRINPPGYERSVDLRALASQAHPNPTAASAKMPPATGQRTPTSHLASEKSVYSGYGLGVVYPKGWALERPANSESLVTFVVNHTGSEQPTMIELKVFSSHDVTAQALEAVPPHNIFGKLWRLAWLKSLPESMHYLFKEDSDGREHKHGRSYGAVQIKPQIAIGTNKSVIAYQSAYWGDAPTSPKEYLRSVAFTSAPYVFQLNYVSTEKNAPVSNAQFDQLLAELQIASTSPRGSSAAMARHR